MTPSRLGRFVPALTAIVLVLGACETAGSSPSASTEPTATASPSAAVPSRTPSGETAPSATATATQTTEPATPAPSFGSGDFEIAPNAAADALFAERDDCANASAGYRLEFPDEWWTNTAFGDVEPCVWFSPTTFEANGAAPPDEIAIVIEYVEGDVGFVDEVVTRDEGRVGVTQDAVRLELRGAGGSGGTMPPEWRQTAYVVQLGPTPEEGPNLFVHTDTDMGGDYELNRAVLDRIMATIEFVGSVD